MPLALSTETATIADLLAGPNLFSIPVYQRPYSWTIAEASQLLEDVLAASGTDNPETAEPDYFLGPILLLLANGGDGMAGAGRLEIVDGQQRLVTLNILMCALRDLDDGDSDAILSEVTPLVRGEATAGRAGPYRLELRGTQQAFLERCVLDDGGCSEMPVEETLTEPARRVLDVREHFISELATLDGAQRLQLVHYIKRQCYFAVMRTRDIERAHRMFLVINGRGKPLSRHDILKAEILNKVPAADAERALAAWDATAQRLDEDDFEAFFSHVRAIHGHYRPQVITGIRAIISEVGGAGAFIDNVFAPLASAYQRVLHPDDATAPQPAAQVRASLLYLHRLSGAEWVPAAMLAFQRYSGMPQRLADEMRQIERLAHLLRLLCLGSGKRVRRFADLIEALRAGHRLDAEDGPCRLSRDERRTLSYNLRDLHGRNPQACKLTLLRLNDEMAGRLVDVDPAGWTIEHVLPQRTSGSSPWRDQFIDAEEREACLQSLGNLLLVTPRQNDRARNQEFRRKRDIYAESRIGPLAPLTADVLAAEAWRADEIRARERKLLMMLEHIWRIELIREPMLEEAASRHPPRRRKRDA